MDLSQFPESLRSRVLSTVVRNLRAGISIRLGELQGEVLPLTVARTSAAPETDGIVDLEQHARAAFAALPYTLRIQVGSCA